MIEIDEYGDYGINIETNEYILYYMDKELIVTEEELFSLNCSVVRLMHHLTEKAMRENRAKAGIKDD